MELALITLGQISLCFKSISHWLPNTETEKVTAIILHFLELASVKINEAFIRKCGLWHESVYRYLYIPFFKVVA